MEPRDPLLEEIINLTCAAIRCRSSLDEPAERQRCLDLFLDYLGNETFAIDRREWNGVPSALVRPRGVERPETIFCGHLDVVPAEPSQYDPRVEGDRLHGRGAMDMKAGMAAVAAVMKRNTRRPFPWWFLLVTDEEVGGTNGAARWATEPGLEAGLFLVAEPSELNLSTESKGVLRLEIGHRGKSGHASQPWEGESSVERVMGALPAIRGIIPEAPVEIWKTTASLTVIKGGAVINQVPDTCTLSIDIRYIPGDNPQTIIKSFREALPGFEVRVLDLYPYMLCRPDSPPLLALGKAYERVTGRAPSPGREHGATDARYFSDRMDALIFGPGGAGLHGPEEWVSLSQTAIFARVLEEWGSATLRG